MKGTTRTGKLLRQTRLWLALPVTKGPRWRRFASDTHEIWSLVTIPLINHINVWQESMIWENNQYEAVLWVHAMNNTSVSAG
jgi:hypothetical protein